ncbi:MAG: hypothetical protein R6W91_04300 [Thermoplasmata archaeon]
MVNRPLQNDESARVPFAMVAVLILMLSVFSMAYMGGIQRQEAGLRLVGAEASRQSSILHQIEEKMAIEGVYIASKAVVASTQFLCNQSMLDSCFQQNYSAYLNAAFPLLADPYRIEVRDFVSMVFLEERNLHDLVSSNRTTEQNMTLKDGTGAMVNDTVETLDTVSAEEFNETSALARYLVVGRGNCTVRNMLSGSAMEKPISFERAIDSPFPIMNSKMRALEAAGDSNALGLARTVKYILTTLAQFRVLEGYGSGLDAAPGGTTDIITPSDVQLAVNIAVLLETARQFRDYDAGVLHSLDEMGLGTEGQTLTSLLADYLNTGTLDPADIVALCTGLGDRELPVDMILAQAFNAIADQFILKYLDYFGIMDIANDIYRTTQKIGALIDDVGRTLSQFIFGDDGESRNEAEQVTGWIDNLGAGLAWPPIETGIHEVLIGQGPCAPTDIAVLDILQPIAENHQYSGNCRQLMGGISEPIMDTDGAIIGALWHSTIQPRNVTAETRSGEYLADFQPASMLRNTPELETLWNDFYEQHYSPQQDAIYGTIRDAVKNVTLELSSIITAFIGQKTLCLSEYAGGAFAIDPKDRTSVLENVKDMIGQAMDEATGHLQSNPGAVNAMLAALTDEQARLTIDFMEFVSLNYDIIAGRDSCVGTAVHSLSASMLHNASFSTLLGTPFSASYSIYNDLGHARGCVDDALPYDTAESPDTNTHVRIIMEQNTASLASDLATHADAAYSRLREAETAWECFGSPGNGLFIKALESKVGTDSGSILLRFIGREPSALVGMASNMVIRVLDGITWSGEVSNTQYAPEIAYSNVSGRIPFEMYESDRAGAADAGALWAETFTVVQPDGMLEVISVIPEQNVSLLPPGILAVCISEPSGVHYTDAVTFNERPFENCWNVSIKGKVRLSVSGSSLPYLGDGTHEPAVTEGAIVLDLDIPVLAYSGWDLAGVNYSGTADLAGDVEKLLDMMGDFFGWIWDTLAGPIDWIIDQIMIVVDFFADIIGTLLGYASDIMSIMTDIIGFLVETVQDFLRDVAGWVFDKIVGWIIDLLPDGMEFRFSMFGFDFLVAFASESEIGNANSGKGGRLVSIETEGEFLGAGLELGMEIVALSDEVAESVDMDYDLLLWSSVNISGFVLDTRVDPFMAVQEHIVECNGVGNGFGLELFVPVVECYDSIQYSLHDIPGVGAALSNIPIPFLGLKASVNAGLEILYTLRGIEADHVVINEVELNPRGGNSREPMDRTLQSNGFGIQPGQLDTGLQHPSGIQPHLQLDHRAGPWRIFHCPIFQRDHTIRIS